MCLTGTVIGTEEMVAAFNEYWQVSILKSWIITILYLTVYKPGLAEKKPWDETNLIGNHNPFLSNPLSNLISVNFRCSFYFLKDLIFK